MTLSAEWLIIALVLLPLLIAVARGGDRDRILCELEHAEDTDLAAKQAKRRGDWQ